MITETKHVTEWKNPITFKAKIVGKEREFIVDFGKLVTIKPPDKKIINRKISPITRKYQDVFKNEVKLAGKNTLEVESTKIKRELETAFHRMRRHKAATQYRLAMGIWLKDTKIWKHDEDNQPLGNRQNIYKLRNVIGDEPNT